MGIMLRMRTPGRIIAPCLPTKTDKLPSGSQWLHEIKHARCQFLAKVAIAAATHGCVISPLRCVKYLTHWHGATAPASHMLAARWGATS